MYKPIWQTQGIISNFSTTRDNYHHGPLWPAWPIRAGWTGLVHFKQEKLPCNATLDNPRPVFMRKITFHFLQNTANISASRSRPQRGDNTIKIVATYCPHLTWKKEHRNTGKCFSHETIIPLTGYVSVSYLKKINKKMLIYQRNQVRLT